MTTGLPLLDYAESAPKARRKDPTTSHEAANKQDGPRGARGRAQVLAIHREHPGGLTDFQLSELTGRQQTSCGKRRGELRDLGLIVDSGERRPSHSGSPSIVWRIRE